MANGKRELVPRDHIFPLLVFYCLLFLLKNEKFHAIFIHKWTVLDSFYLLVSYFEKFSTWKWRLSFAVNVIQSKSLQWALAESASG